MTTKKPSEDNQPKNKITGKLIWEFEITWQQLAAIALPLLTAGWVTFQSLVNSTPILPPTTSTTVQIDRLPVNSQF
jgi:hypothetical protein